MIKIIIYNHDFMIFKVLLEFFQHNHLVNQIIELMQEMLMVYIKF
jgi:hypothetical protein